MRTAPVRQSLIDSAGSRGEMCRADCRARRTGSRGMFGLAMLALLGVPAGLLAQTEPPAAGGASAPPTATSPGGTLPLSAYMPREHLLLYMEFSGLDAHTASWQKSAA